MKGLKGALFLTLLLLVPFLRGFGQATFSLAPESRMWVEGTSSLHDWKCDVPVFTGRVVLVPTDSLPRLQVVEVEVPVEKMDCGNKTMNRKMRDALKADEHPRITFRMLRHVGGEALTDTTFTVRLEGELQIAGVTRTTDLEAVGSPVNGTYRFQGKKALRMTDFGIKPPTALLGTLKTGDEVTVFFDVLLQPAESTR